MCNSNRVAVEAFMNAIKQFIGSQYKRRIIEQRSFNASQFLNGVELFGLVEVGLVHTSVHFCSLHTACCTKLLCWTCTSAIVLGSKFIACRRLTHTQRKHAVVLVVLEHNSLCSILYATPCKIVLCKSLLTLILQLLQHCVLSVGGARA